MASGDPAATTGAEDKVLHVYNWIDFIGPTTIADFETRTGIRVVYDTYDSNEILETKMLTGARRATTWCSRRPCRSHARWRTPAPSASSTSRSSPISGTSIPCVMERSR